MNEVLVQAGVTALIQLIVEAAKAGELTQHQKDMLTESFQAATEFHDSLQKALKENN
jgi:hypothetical protein